MSEVTKLKLVTLKNPCNACLILCNLTKEIIQKLRNQNNQIVIEMIELEHMNQAHTVEGLEVEMFPAIIIDGEQVTAGSLPKRDLLESLGYKR